jgi:non-canonical poly(A) RNA polymerase PAPD5/7
VRLALVSRIRKVIVDLWYDTDVRVFGSFAAGLYLPTSDVDLVILSHSFCRYRTPKYASNRSLHAVASTLRKHGFVKQGSMQVITRAKVPIVKFVDEKTNLQVDISFENDSGLVANDTFLRWCEEYPAVPHLVLLIKHFLSMRGLNEVYHGGIGSFTITCLAVSLHQLLPAITSGQLKPAENLGSLLLEFLNLYGSRFDTRNTGIRVDSASPGYFDKRSVFPDAPKRNNNNSQMDLLCIQDPNNPTNDISRSSYQILQVLNAFRDAEGSLVDLMRRLDMAPLHQRKGVSLLGVLVGGNYDGIEQQRDRMARIYVADIGEESDIQRERAQNSGHQRFRDGEEELGGRKKKPPPQNVRQSGGGGGGGAQQGKLPQNARPSAAQQGKNEGVKPTRQAHPLPMKPSAPRAPAGGKKWNQDGGQGRRPAGGRISLE